ncbi:MAG: immunoglobulin domain-containing protein [Verrucomicrobiota bacterium]
MKTLSSIRTLILAVSLPLCAWRGADTAHAAPGTVAAWGRNNSGQTTVPAAAQSGVIAIAAGGEHTVALKNDGSVLSWGAYGQTTVPVAAQSGVTAIAAGDYHTVALKNDGSVVAWGDNSSGQTTVPVAAQSGVTAIAAGASHTVALKNDGSVLSWGYYYDPTTGISNDCGQTTVPVAAQSGVTAISGGGGHTVALKNDGTVLAWGNDGAGKTNVPVEAQSGVTAIAAGRDHTVALKNDGSVVSWGRYVYYDYQYDEYGNLYYNYYYSYDFGQTPVAAQSGITAIAAADYHTVALKNDGSVVAWGPSGILYDPYTDTYSDYPSPDYGQTTVPAGLSGVTALAAGGFHTVALVIPIAPAITTPPTSQTVNAGNSASFTVVATGSPLNYQWRKDGTDISGATAATYSVGDVFGHAGSYTVVVSNPLGSVTSTPPAVLTVTGNVPVIGTPPMSQTVTAGQSVGFTVAATGYALSYQWRKDGTNISGATGATYTLGNAWFSDAGSYTVVVSNYVGSVTSTPAAVMTVSAALPKSMVAWGNNTYGQTTAPVEAQSGVTAIAAGRDHTVVLKNDGSVVAWGDNWSGQTTVPVAAQSGVTAIAAGDYHTVALKNDGSVVAWGRTSTTVPVAAQSGVTAIAAGYDHTVAVKSNGSVVAWGWNGYGQTDVPVAAQRKVIAIAAGYGHTVAVKTNGSVVAWGYNGFGQTDVPVAAQSGVTAIAAGDYHTVALKNDGSVVAWGSNYYGQTMVPMAAQSGVIAIAAGWSHTVALLGTVPPPSFARWAAGFGLSGLAHADPDHDGLATVLEYILGGNPAQPFPATPRPVASLSGDSMLFTFPRLDAAETSDMTLTVESGTDLVTWPDVFTIRANTAASSPGVTILENGTAPDTITVAIPAGSGNARFARLKATIAP